MIKCLTIIQIELEFESVGEENWSTRRKTSWSKEENRQQTQPTYDAKTRNQTRATFVEGECSHHCAIPTPRTRRIFREWNHLPAEVVEVCNHRRFKIALKIVSLHFVISIFRSTGSEYCFTLNKRYVYLCP